MIPLDLLLAMRGRWERKALALFLATFDEEREAVEMAGESEITPDRWLTALLAVWQGAGDEWAEQVAVSINTDQEVAESMFFLLGAGVRITKGMRDNPDTWRKLIQFITVKSEAIVDGTQAEVALAEALGNPVTGVYDDIILRVETMASTETVQSMNFSQSETVKSRAPQLLKIWQAILDDRTRPTHMDANGQIRKLNDPYDVGGAALQWPADAGGPLSEIINCRCHEDYQLPE